MSWLREWLEHASRRATIFDWAEECPELIPDPERVRVVVVRGRVSQPEGPTIYLTPTELEALKDSGGQ
jgi:hypothetical protein